MASKRLLVTDENEGYEKVQVQIEWSGANTKSTGKVFHLNGHEYPISRFGSWTLHKIDDGEVAAMLADGDVIVGITWAFSHAYRELAVWVNDVCNSRFTLEMNKSHKKIVLNEVGNGAMAKKLEETFKRADNATAYKGFTIDSIKIISDEGLAKKPRKNDKEKRSSEEARSNHLLESERVAKFMQQKNYSRAFAALKTGLESQNVDVARLLMLMRLAICALHMKIRKEVDAVFPQMLRLMKTVDIPPEEVFLYRNDYVELYEMLLNRSKILAIQLSFAFVEIAKKLPDVSDRLDKVTLVLIAICTAIRGLLMSGPSACLKSEALQYLKKMTSEVEFMGKQTDCDSLVRAQSIYLIEFNIAELRCKLGKREETLFRDSTMEFKRSSSCWADLPFVVTRLKHHPEICKYMQEPAFCDDVRHICKNPSLLQRKIKDPKIARANEILMSNFLIFESESDIVEACSNMSKSEAGTSTESKKDKKLDKPLDKKQEAQKEKVKGNEAYKRKKFETALSHYDKAISLDPTNALLYWNKAAVFLTRDRFEEAKSSCLTALGLTQNSDRHDDKDVAKIIARLARVESLAGNPLGAIPIYKRSLRLNFDPKIQAQMDECQEMINADCEEMIVQ